MGRGRKTRASAAAEEAAGGAAEEAAGGEQTMVVRLGDEDGPVLLRKKPNHRKGPWLKNRAAVDEDATVTVLKREGAFAFVRTHDGDQGFIKAACLEEVEQSDEEEAPSPKKAKKTDDVAPTPKKKKAAAESPAPPQASPTGKPKTHSKPAGRSRGAASAADEAEEADEPAAAADGEKEGEEKPEGEAEKGADDGAKKPEGLESLPGRWAQLVLRCARALKRSSANLPVYVSEVAIGLQRKTLGEEAMEKILALSVKEWNEGVLDEDEKNFINDTLSRAIKSPSLEKQNGAKAALSVVKYIAGFAKEQRPKGPPKPKKDYIKISCADSASAAASAVANVSAALDGDLSAPPKPRVNPEDDPALGWLTGKTSIGRQRGPKKNEVFDIGSVVEKPTYKDIHQALESVTIPVNHTRFNVKSTQNQEVTGMCLGVVNARSNGVVSSSFGRLRPNLTKTLCNFAKTAVPDFHFTSIQVSPRACAVATVWGNEVGCSLARAVRQVNKNYMSALHVDKNNVRATLSLLFAAGSAVSLTLSASLPSSARATSSAWAATTRAGSGSRPSAAWTASTSGCCSTATSRTARCPTTARATPSSTSRSSPTSGWAPAAPAAATVPRSNRSASRCHRPAR